MRSRSKIAVATVMVALVAIAAPVLAATVFRGSISLMSPGNGAAVSDSAQITWQYRTGTVVKRASKVGVYRSFDRVNWTLIVGGLPITALRYDLSTAGLEDGAYLMRLVADGKIASGANKVIVDNTAPVVSITKPSNGAVIVDDTSVATPDAIVVGRSTLQAAAEDATSGVASVVWTLGDTQIAHGATTTYDFSAAPGRHILTATVTDRAGNRASSSVWILALPGQSQASQPPSPSPAPVPSDLPTAVPTDLPTTLPTDLPTALPTDLPTAPPTPPATPTPPAAPEPPASPEPTPPGLPTPLPTPTL